jgi:hypothetical protein
VTVEAQLRSVVVDLDDDRVLREDRVSPGGPRRQRGAEREDEVRALEGADGRREREAAGDADVGGVPVEHALGERRRRERRAEPVGELGDGVARPGEPGAAARDDDRRARGQEVVDDPPDDVAGRHRPRHHVLGSGAVGRGPVLPGPVDDAPLEVQRHVEDDRAALDECAPVGAPDVVGGRVGPVDPLGDAAGRLDESGLVDEEVGPPGAGGGGPGDDDQGRAGLRRVGERRQGVREPGPLVDGADGERPARAPVGVGRAGGGGLVPGADERGAGPHERVGRLEVSAADDAEHPGHPEVGERLPDHLRDEGPHLRVHQCLRPASVLMTIPVTTPDWAGSAR